LRYPTIIQGGMGVGVSSSRLARTVACAGQLGVVSGTATAVTQARQLAIGDPGGHVRRALDAFPYPEVAARVRTRYLDTATNGEEAARFPSIPQPSLDPPAALTELTVVGNFVEVWLAKEGHDGLVGVNYLEKIQLPTLASLYGALLAGADYVLMGAGVPARIPALLDELVQHRAVAMPVTVEGSERGQQHQVHFDPAMLAGTNERPELVRPNFLAIVSSSTMATFLARNASGSPDGFVVELPTAGGHNAPPRGRLTLDAAGEPVYGPRDAVDLDAIAALGLPFWLAGGFATPEQLAQARSAGAQGVQIGTAFAFCEESGMAPELRAPGLQEALAGTATVVTDPRVSPTGYPFKILRTEQTVSEPDTYTQRPRLCDLGYLRSPYVTPGGKVGYRCPAEPVDDYVRKGGDLSDTVDRRCLCNALVSTIGLAQQRQDGYVEAPLLTAGDDIVGLTRFVGDGATSYSALDVIDHLLGPSERTFELTAASRGT
jgi:NAD(P)H-dependent flavin oxidoreductase YrpB (nitropropane dioxygenase family)